LRFADEIVGLDASKLPSQVYNGVIARKSVEDMDGFETEFEHPKKRRRRLSQRTPASARLVGDEDLRGITSVVSDDLWTNVFGFITGTLSNYLDHGSIACY
jgi:hypothetical protein